MKIVLLLTIFLLLFIINLLLKMIIPFIFADYFVKKWVIYYEVGKKNYKKKEMKFFKYLKNYKNRI